MAQSDRSPEHMLTLSLQIRAVIEDDHLFLVLFDQFGCRCGFLVAEGVYEASYIQIRKLLATGHKIFGHVAMFWSSLGKSFAFSSLNKNDVHGTFRWQYYCHLAKL